jgi:hypothetical protein
MGTMLFFNNIMLSVAYFYTFVKCFYDKVLILFKEAFKKGDYAPDCIRLVLLPKRMCLTMMMQE